jgi:hypothetical protein
MVTLKIDGLILETVAAHQTQPLSLRILGTGFTASSQVKIGDSPLRKPAHTTPTQLDVSLAACGGCWTGSYRFIGATCWGTDAEVAGRVERSYTRCGRRSWT